MLRRVTCLAALFLAATLPASASPESGTSPDLSWLSAIQGEFGISLADKPDGVKATCTASCSPYLTVTCSYTSPSTCTAADRNCAIGQSGFVKCGTSVFPCTPPCDEEPPPVECEGGAQEGGITYYETGFCCAGRTEYEKFRCTSGQWVSQGTVCMSPFCDPP
jgi:hypothetical protein